MSVASATCFLFPLAMWDTILVSVIEEITCMPLVKKILFFLYDISTKVTQKLCFGLVC